MDFFCGLDALTIDFVYAIEAAKIRSKALRGISSSLKNSSSISFFRAENSNNKKGSVKETPVELVIKVSLK